MTTARVPPTVEDLLKEVASPSPTEDGEAIELDAIEQEKFERTQLEREFDWQEKFARLQAFENHHRNKGKWSLFVMVIMAFMIGFQSLLLMLVGLDVWDFTKYEWLLPTLMVQNLAQVIALAVVIVKALHDAHKA